MNSDPFGRPFKDQIVGISDIDQLVRHVRVFDDFPRPGVAFQDLSPLYAMPGVLRRLGADLADAFAGGFDCVLAIEARGFVVGAAVAMTDGWPLVLARKRGKLPGPVDIVDYDLEYGAAELEVQSGALSAGQRVLIIDDVLATGGTLAAAAELVDRAGAVVVGCGVVLQLAALGGTKRLAGHRVVAAITVP
jgi:adenine phosphoribosyltransferase